MSRQASYSSARSYPNLPLGHGVSNSVSSSNARYSPQAENFSSSLGTVYRAYGRTASPTSLEREGYTLPLKIRDNNVLQSLTTLPSLVNNDEDTSVVSNYVETPIGSGNSFKRVRDVPLPSSAEPKANLMVDQETLENINFRAEDGTPVQPWARHSNIEQQPLQRLPCIALGETIKSGTPINDHASYIENETDITPHPFRRWMSTLRRKSSRRRIVLNAREERWPPGETLQPMETLRSRKLGAHRKSSSWSSSDVFTAVKSAGMSLSTLSTMQQSRNARRSTLLQSSNRSSRFSQSFNRASLESPSETMQVVDQATWERAVRRRQILEELITSEESYIADLKVLVNVYFTLLASTLNSSQRLLRQIHVNITEMLTLHEDLLTRICEVLKSPESKQAHNTLKHILKRPLHLRWHSMDSPQSPQSRDVVFTVRKSAEAPRPSTSKHSIIISEPNETAEVAQIFQELMSRFFVYEEYGARYESMLYDMTATSRTMPKWHAYEQGIEALASTLAPTSGREELSRKGLTFADLLIKPIQRVCRYPLLFADLYKNTPVIDGPESHAEIEKTLCRLRETAAEINKATNDKPTQSRIQRSWHLQDLLVYPNQYAAPFAIRSLGHATLCGVLHVVYQSKSGVGGDYMLCALFRTCLIMAMPKISSSNYDIVVDIGLGDLRVDRTNNGRGLQCHTALYSWKILFESDQQLFELILSACSSREEDQWVSHLTRCSSKEWQQRIEDRSASLLQSSLRCSMLSLDLKPLGDILGQPGTLARRISIQRAATVGAKTNVCQVLIKNTHALQDSGDLVADSISSISRSKSLLSTHRVPVLAPKRTDRIRMEHDLANVWTRDLLPYPGMGASRGEQLIRASASSMMRRLSRASIASGFTKRSTSLTSLANGKNEVARDSMERVDETEGEVRALAGAHPSTDPVPIPNIHNNGSLRCIVPPARTSSANSIIPIKHTSSVTDRERSEMLVKAGAESKDGPNKTPKHRWNGPISLIKSISTEGMKGFFG